MPEAEDPTNLLKYIESLPKEEIDPELISKVKRILEIASNSASDRILNDVTLKTILQFVVQTAGLPETTKIELKNYEPTPTADIIKDSALTLGSSRNEDPYFVWLERDGDSIAIAYGKFRSSDASNA